MSAHPDSSLEAGLTALKQGDYQTAIDYLEAVSQALETEKTGLKAMRGLVVAYERCGEIDKAIALCQTLSQSKYAQLRDWAIHRQKSLTKKQKKATQTQTNITGFVPFDSSSPPSPVEEDMGEQGTGDAGIGNWEESLYPSSDSPSPLVSSHPKTPIPEAAMTVGGETPPLQESISITQFPTPSNWRQAGRAQRSSNLKPVSLIPLWMLSVGSAVALFWVIRAILQFVMAVTNDILVKLPFLEPIQLFYADPTALLLLALVLLLVLSPWLLDAVLEAFYGRRSLDLNSLTNYSPEASRVLQRYCRQRGWSVPNLATIPLKSPIALTYGNLPRTARIVVSQGLLELLADDEIAAIYATQLGHIKHKDFVLMSLVLLVTLFPYGIYMHISHWGDRIDNKILRSLATAIASLAYLVWSLLTGTGLWLSQVRLYLCDRTAVEITGNPNGLIRALLKIAQGIADDITNQGQTNPQLESLNLLAPVGYQQALSLGSLVSHTAIEPALKWDYLNPYRYLFAINNTHALIGDRTLRLCQIARQWRLQPELDLQPTTEPATINRSAFYRQIAPWLGMLVGPAAAGLLWLVWQIALRLGFLNLYWIYEDLSFIIGSALIGWSIGTFVRINSFFPDIKPSQVQTDPDLLDLLASPTDLPSQSHPVRISGKLLGRRGVCNWWGQDLVFQVGNQLVKLHHLPSPSKSSSTKDLIGRQVMLTGWFRRGATPWIDIETLRTQSGRTVNSYHPIWSTLWACTAAVLGIYILWAS
ncbi:MAG: zinc metalloprotease HtpX [Nostocaceae cyanobacterium]|nr:zinc metalloprotease HtpX [Nostocaceae cyanobacterium]